MKEDHLKLFFEEAEELLQKIELCLVELENFPTDKDIIGETFRALHTIKGSSGMFGLDKISGFTHDIENLFDSIRNEELSVSKAIIDLTLESVDQIKLMLANIEDTDKTILLTTRFKKLNNPIENIEENLSENTENLTEVVNSKNKLISYKIRFEPNPDIFYSGTNPLSLIEELCSLGNSIVVAHTDRIPLIDEIDPEKIYIYWDIVLTTSSSLNSIKDVFIFIEDESKIKIDILDENSKLGDKEYRIKVETFLKEKKNFTSADIILQTKDNLVQKLSQNEQTVVNKTNSSIIKDFASGRIKVDSEKLDSLVNLVGELVTVQAHLAETVSNYHDSALTAISEEVERLTWSLRDNALTMRMIPIGTKFNRFNRLVRDLSNELGKKVVLETSGAETELDKNVIERLNDPLVHIIRNNIDHGIESPENRIAKGKPEKGTIFLSAEYSGANVIVKIRDDGAGLNLESIRRKAIDSGIIDKSTNLKDKDIYRLIFAPGFSTAEKVTNTSGRGVGMDVVVKTIESLRGSIDLESKPDQGTTVILKLPITLAIIDGLLVRISEEFFVIPLSYVEECIELTTRDIDNFNGKCLVKVRDEIVPYIPLRTKFSIEGKTEFIQQIVIVNVNNSRYGFLVDEIVGEHQTVIKSLGKFIKNVDGLSGLTILGDGNIALIADVPKLIKSAEVEELELVN